MLSFSKNGQHQKASTSPTEVPIPATAAPSQNVVHQRPDPEVVQKASRRRFSLAYKRAILAEVDACQHSGEIGVILRREGLYYSALRHFRQQLDRFNPASSKDGTPRGHKPPSSPSLTARISQLEGEKKRLERKLQQAQTVIAVQKKVSELLGLTLENSTLAWDEEDR